MESSLVVLLCQHCNKWVQGDDPECGNCGFHCYEAGDTFASDNTRALDAKIVNIDLLMRTWLNELQTSQEAETQQAQDNPLYTKSILVAASEHSTPFTWHSTEDRVGGELVEQGKASYIQEVESSLSGLRSPCQRC